VLPVESPDLLVLCLQAFSHTKISSESLDQCLMAMNKTMPCDTETIVDDNRFHTG
jgi:hypothetical protein